MFYLSTKKLGGCFYHQESWCFFVYSVYNTQKICMFMYIRNYSVYTLTKTVSFVIYEGLGEVIHVPQCQLS